MGAACFDRLYPGRRFTYGSTKEGERMSDLSEVKKQLQDLVKSYNQKTEGDAAFIQTMGRIARGRGENRRKERRRLVRYASRPYT